MSPLARVRDEQLGELSIASVDGEIDASNAADISERLRAALTNRSLALVVDLTEASYIDSAGLNVLFALDLELRQRRQQLHLVVPPASPIARMLAITGLDVVVPTRATRAAALEEAAAG